MGTRFDSRKPASLIQEPLASGQQTSGQHQMKPQRTPEPTGRRLPRLRMISPGQRRAHVGLAPSARLTANSYGGSSTASAVAPIRPLRTDRPDPHFVQRADRDGQVGCGQPQPLPGRRRQPQTVAARRRQRIARQLTVAPARDDSRSSPLEPANQASALLTRIGNAVRNARSLRSKSTFNTGTCRFRARTGPAAGRHRASRPGPAEAA
jgi:hypothetical protein